MSERRFAVLIGNGLYPEEPKLTDLRCPSRDVDGVAQILQSPKHGAFTSTLVLKDRPHHEILLEVNRTLKKAAKTDLVFLYYSGHGKLDLANRLHLCASDTVIDALEATSVPVESIKNYIDVSPPRQVTLVLDCCFSGAVGKVFARSGVDDQLQLMSGGRGTYIMSASTGVQVALEKEEDEYSIFTKRIIEGIETGAADSNGDGIVTMDELYHYVHDRVLEDGFQEPMKWGINVRGELIIAKTGKSPREERRRQIRQRLLELASSGVLPDRILTQAMELLSKGATELPPALQPQGNLLEKILDERIAVGEFIGEWYALEFQARTGGRLSDSIRTPVPPAPPPAEGRPVEPAVPPPLAQAEEAAVEAPLPSPATGRPPAEAESGSPAVAAPPPPATPSKERPRPKPPRPPVRDRAPLEATSVFGLPGVLWRAARQPGAGFWKWLGVSFVGVAVAAMAATLGGALLGNFRAEWFLESYMARAVLGGMVSGGLAMALFQKWRFKSVGFPAKGWILASTFGWGVGGGLLGVGLIGGGGVFEHWLDTALVAAAGGALAGIMQAGVLGVVTTQAGWWPWLSVAGLPGGLALGGILATLKGSDDEVVISVMLVVGAIGWWVVSAAGLTWLVGSLDPRTTARDDRAIARGAAMSRALGYAFVAWLALRLLTRFL